jgi:hypothetical protein
MKPTRLLLTGFLIVTFSGIAITIYALSKRNFTSSVYYSNGSCITMAINNTYFTTTGGMQAVVEGDDGNSYSLYSNSSCTLPVYFTP